MGNNISDYKSAALCFAMDLQLQYTTISEWAGFVLALNGMYMQGVTKNTSGIS